MMSASLYPDLYYSDLTGIKLEKVRTENIYIFAASLAHDRSEPSHQRLTSPIGEFNLNHTSQVSYFFTDPRRIVWRKFGLIIKTKFPGAPNDNIYAEDKIKSMFVALAEVSEGVFRASCPIKYSSGSLSEYLHSIEPNGEADHDEPTPLVNGTKAEEKEEV